MHYIERDAEGRIVRIEIVEFNGMTEQAEEATAEINEWLKVNSIRTATFSNCSKAISIWFVFWKTLLRY